MLENENIEEIIDINLSELQEENKEEIIEDFNNIRIKVDKVIKKGIKIPKEKFDELESELYQKEQNFTIRNNELMSNFMDNKITLEDMGKELESTKVDLNLLKILVNVLEQNMEIVI